MNSAPTFAVVVGIALLISLVATAPVPGTAGFEIGEVTGYKLLKQSGSSKLYEI
jgi:hypothetical protein